MQRAFPLRTLPGLIAVCSLVFWALPVAALQDPTRPPGAGRSVAAPVPERTLSLDSILIGAGRRVAVIEGEALTEGQSVDGIRVVRIHSNRVVVMDQGAERVLYLDTLPQVRRTQ